jgi:hypothetical protein
MFLPIYTFEECEVHFTTLCKGKSAHAYVCMYVCMYAHMYVCTYVCMHVCMYARMYVCTYVCMHVCMYAHMYVGLVSSVEQMHFFGLNGFNKR